MRCSCNCGVLDDMLLLLLLVAIEPPAPQEPLSCELWLINDVLPMVAAAEYLLMTL